MDIRFEWDPAKDRSNVRKHGIDFATATLVFDDPFLMLEIDRVENGEQRWRTTGVAIGLTVIVVAHTIREEDVEVIRIISARRAERLERQRYEREARQYDG